MMDRGAARQVRDAWPAAQYELGRLVWPGYGFLAIELGSGQFLGVLQVKEHWADMAWPHIIKHSLGLLAERARNAPKLRFHVNCPGTGNGGLAFEDIEALLQVLPDNVWVYR